MAAAQSPLVSAVIPTFNRGPLLERAIGSVLAQTYRPVEIIVVNDGSTDDTAARVGRLDIPGLRYFHTRANAGAAAARNLGIAEARGDLIAFLDADDEWLPEKIARQVAAFAGGPQRIALIYCGAAEVSPDWPTVERHPVLRGALFEKLRLRNFLRTPSVMVRRDVLDRVGGFDCGLAACEDWDLWLRIARDYLIDYVDYMGVRVHTGRGDQLSYRSRAVFLANATIFKRYNGGAVHGAALGTHLALQSRELLSLGRRRWAARFALRSLALQPTQAISRRVLKQLIKQHLPGGV